MSQSSLLLTAFLNGFLGSIHCLGMCGPISLLIQTKSENSTKTNFLYNIGRTFSYTFVGSLLGSFGWGLNRFFLADLAFWIGIVFLLFLSLGYFFPNFFSFHISSYQSKIFSSFTKQISKIQNPSFLALGFGLISGLLPCGLLYPAYGLALLSGSISSGALVMFVFSLGTYPMMFGVNFFSQTIKKFLGKSKFGYFLGATLLAFAVYSIYYRINLNESENCHTPSSP